MADIFEATLAALADGAAPTQEQAKAASKILMGDVLSAMSERGVTAEAFPVEPARLAGLLRLRLENRVSSTGAAEVFAAMLDADDAPEAVAEARGLFQVSDAGALGPVVDGVLAANPGQVAAWLGGKEALVGFFIGQTMKAFKERGLPGSPDPVLLRRLVLDRLAALR